MNELVHDRMSDCDLPDSRTAEWGQTFTCSCGRRFTAVEQQGLTVWLDTGADLLDKLEKLQVLTLQSGDILVATIAHGSFNVDRAARIKDQLKQFVPDNDVMVLADVELAALRMETPRPAPADQGWLQLETS